MLMKRGALAILLSILILLPAMAQTEVVADTLRTQQALDITTQAASQQRISDDGMRNYGGFLLDMNSMLQPTQPMTTTTVPSLSAPMQTSLYGYRDLDRMLQLKSKATYGISNTTLGISNTPFGFRAMPLGMGISSFHTANFKLNNGMTLTTYGNYDSSGRRHISQSALPWQRNNFQGGFKLKSANGNFSVQVHVSRGYVPY